jgi:hypothetical protein
MNQAEWQRLANERTDGRQVARGAIMDQESLVTVQLEDGRRLLERLARAEIPVVVAAWIKESESGLWYLYLVTPLVVEDDVTRPAYRRVNEVIQEMPQRRMIGPLEIKVVWPNGAVGTALRELVERYPGTSPFRYGGSRLGDLNIEGAYVYPTITAPVG